MESPVTKNCIKKRNSLSTLHRSSEAFPESFGSEKILIGLFGFHGTDNQISAQRGRLAVLVTDLCLDGQQVLVTVEAGNFLHVFFIDKAPAYLFGAGELLVIRVQFLVEEKEFLDSRLLGNDDRNTTV